MHRLFLTLAIAVLIVGYLIFCIWHMKRLTDISTRLIAQHVPFHRENPSGTPNIAVLGDSLALGVGADANGSIAAYFGRDFPDADVTLFARSGMRVKELDETFPTFADGSRDFMLLEIGANDITHFTSMNDFKASLRSVFRKAKKASKNVAALHSSNVGLAPFFPRPFNWLMTLRTRSFRSAYMTIAKEEGVAYVDLYRSSWDNEMKDTGQFYASDFLHLTSEGYGIWYGEIRSVMAREGISL